ncbi:MAG TPA: universal stress protein [Streptosporangiaceae bacterium]|nr:universal stress protein [Streptosporangiaceae bacterium]
MVTQVPASSRIVVGVDGSPSSKAALRWAVRQADLTGTTVDAVIAWHYPLVWAGNSWAPVSAYEDMDFAAIATRTLTEAIGESVSGDCAVKISTTVQEGNAAKVLLDASKGADLLVVGSRGHGGFAEALLGSVSQHCVHHAPCPIVIISAAQKR